MATEWASPGTGHKFVDLGDHVEYYAFPQARYRTGLVPRRRDRSTRVRSPLSLSRSRRMVRWLAEANGALNDTWFFTGTFSEAVTDFSHAVAAWERFRRLIRKEFPDIRYVCVPEVQPVSKRWHFHAIFFGLGGRDVLRARYPLHFVGGKPLPGYVQRLYVLWSSANGHLVASDGSGGDRMDFQSAKSVQGLARYLTKYLTKELGDTVPSDRRCYFSGGRSLRRPVIRKFSNYEPDFVGYSPCGEVVYKSSWESEHVGRVNFYRFKKNNSCREKGRFCGCYSASPWLTEDIPLPEFEPVYDDWVVNIFTAPALWIS